MLLPGILGIAIVTYCLADFPLLVFTAVPLIPNLDNVTMIW